MKTNSSYQLYVSVPLKTTGKLFFTLLLIFSLLAGYAQKTVYFPPVAKDTTKKKRIEIVKSDSLMFETKELGKYRKLIGHVVLRHLDAYMYCDSAVIDIDANYMTALGNQVHIKKGDSVDVWGNFLEYFGDQKLGRLTGMCSMRDKTMILTAPELNYNTETDVGNFMSGGRVVNKGTTITSAIGYYYHKTSEAVFYGNVILRSPERTIYADSLKYNTDKEIAYFITKTTIVDKDSNIIVTNSGFYDTKNEKAYLGNNATIRKGDSYVKANTIDYNNQTKQAVATGNVVWQDSSEHTTILSNYIYSNEDSSYVKAYQDPLMISVSEDQKDTMYLSADTLLSFKSARFTWLTNTDSTGKIDSLLDAVDSVRIVQAFYHMKMIQGDVSAISDSMYYSEVDSIFKLYVSPILWMDSTQISGDSIYLYTKNKEINKVDIYGNAFVVHWQDPDVFNQVKGKFMQAFIEKKKITKIEVDGNAESIYFIKDKDAYTGANKSTSAFITVSFNDGEVNRIKLTGAPEAEFTPMKKINLTSFRLDGFSWHWEKKPKTLYDVIRDQKQYEKFILEQPSKVKSEDPIQNK